MIYGGTFGWNSGPLTASDVVLHVYEKRGDRPIYFGNRRREVHLHGNTVTEIKAGDRTNDATGVLIHRADGTRERVMSPAPGPGTARE
ncbi:MAG: hypothetical protein ABEI52_08525 [Halobacteriaceae archaeon]